MTYSLPIEKLDKFFALAAAQQAFYLPVDCPDGEARFREWEKGLGLSAKTNTARSAKSCFFPQTENIADFKVDGKNIEIIDSRREAEDFAIFGVRACDAASFELLDRVFLAEPVDSYYKTRREHCTVITLACTRPEETCFCQSFGIDACEPTGDARAWLTDTALYIETLTEKGKNFVHGVRNLLEVCGRTEIDEQIAATRRIMSRLPLAQLKPDDFTGKTLETFNSPKWAELSQSCLGCGSCTFVCPTCQCFDIREFDTGHGIKRFRCWDSCMYRDFTAMSAGDPRHTQLERFRQRFMHKLVYFPEKNDGAYGCVGCGRCLKKCPISMNIVKVMKTLGGEDK